MKIKPEHYAYLKGAIATIDLKRIADHRNFVIGEGKSQDVEKRVRWDAVRYAGLIPWICDTLYKYMNDDHIDTALRKIFSELELQNA
jgi:hypothetical protein